MTTANYKGIMKNLQFMQQMSFVHRLRPRTKKRLSYSEKMAMYERSSAILRIINSID